MNNNSKPALTTKQQYRTLKRRFKFLVYENECYQEQLRNLQRKLLKLSRDKNFLLDRLQNYEKVSDSSDDSDAVAVDSTDVGDPSLKKPVKSKDSNALVAKPIDHLHLSSTSTSSVTAAPPRIAAPSVACCPSSLPSQPPKKKRVRNNNKTSSSSTNASTVAIDSRQFPTSAVAANVLPSPPVSKSKGKKQAAPRTTASAAKQRMPTNNIQQNANNNQTAYVNAAAGLSFQVMQDGNGHFSMPMPVPPNLQTIDQQNTTNQSPVLQTLQPLQNFEIVNLPSLNNHVLPPAAYAAMQNLHTIQQQHHHHQQEPPTSVVDNKNSSTLLTLTNVNQDQQQQISVQNHGGIFSQQSMDSQTIDIQ